MKPPPPPPAPSESLSAWATWIAGALALLAALQAPALRDADALLSWGSAGVAGLALAGIGRMLLIRGAAMAGALLALNTNPLWWRLATTPGTAMPHALLIAAALALLIRWHHTDRHAHFSAALLAYALSFGLGQPSLTFLPALVYLVMKTGWKRLLTPARAGWVLLCVALAAGLAVHSATALGLGAADSLAGHFRHALGTLVGVLLQWRALLPLVLLGAAYLPDLDAVAGKAVRLLAATHLLVLCFSRLPGRMDLMLPVLAAGTLQLAATGHALLDWAARRNPLPGAKRLAAAVVLLLAAASLPATIRAVRGGPAGTGPAPAESRP